MCTRFLCFFSRSYLLYKAPRNKDDPFDPRTMIDAIWSITSPLSSSPRGPNKQTNKKPPRGCRVFSCAIIVECDTIWPGRAGVVAGLAHAPQGVNFISFIDSFINCWLLIIDLTSWLDFSLGWLDATALLFFLRFGSRANPSQTWMLEIYTCGTWLATTTATK